MELLLEDIGLYARVEIALNTIRPYLKTDGGDVKIINITTTGILIIEMLGSCGECPMSKMTLKAGIEQAVLKLVPEIKSVRAIHHELAQDDSF